MELGLQDLYIVSIQGRGHGLAAEMKRRGLQVTLFDLTSQMGLWPPEDQEGPFGFFRTDQFSSTFLERLHEEDPYQLVEKGWTFWTEKGPLELRGPTAQHVLKKNGWTDEHIQSLSHERVYTAPLKAREGLKSFWPLAFAHVMANTHQLKSVEYRSASKKLPLAADFLVRFSTRKGHENSLRWLQQLGVETQNESEILDLAAQGRSEWLGFELKGSLSGIHRASQFVWCLSSEETYFYSEKLGEKIFKGRRMEPQWSWMRYRARLSTVPEVRILPLHFVMMGDVESPWTHDNMMIVQRTGSEDQFDFWLKVPSLQRFNREYVDTLWSKIQKRWQERLPRAEPQLVSYPQEYYYTFDDLGPSPLPVFDHGQWKRNKNYQPASNAHLHSPENWGSYNWMSLFEHQQELGQEIWVHWKQEQLRKEKKRDREVHSS